MSHLLTVSDAITSHARLQPNKIGTRDSKRALSFADWDDRAARLANGLLGLGLVKGGLTGSRCNARAPRCPANSILNSEFVNLA